MSEFDEKNHQIFARPLTLWGWGLGLWCRLVFLYNHNPVPNVPISTPSIPVVKWYKLKPTTSRIPLPKQTNLSSYIVTIDKCQVLLHASKPRIFLVHKIYLPQKEKPTKTLEIEISGSKVTSWPNRQVQCLATWQLEYDQWLGSIWGPQTKARTISGI